MVGGATSALPFISSNQVKRGGGSLCPSKLALHVQFEYKKIRCELLTINFEIQKVPFYHLNFTFFLNFATLTKKTFGAHVLCNTYEQSAQKYFATTFTNQYVSLCYKEHQLNIQLVCLSSHPILKIVGGTCPPIESRHPPIEI